MSPINVFGAGAFGTALAISLARTGQHICLVARSSAHRNSMIQDRENQARLPRFRLPKSLTVATEPDAKARVSLLAVPTKNLNSLVQTHCNALTGQYAVACCKGVDLHSGLGPTDIIQQAWPKAVPAVLSGPSFAVDIAGGLPTALTLAASTERSAQELQNLLKFSNIRLYRSTDISGVELGGALKNVVAIASGIAIGAGLGESARAALMTRGYNEMKRFAVHRGALPETLSGLSGFGDLVLTCTSEKSRNFYHGITLGRGNKPDSGATVEGIRTAAAVAQIAEECGIDMPITTAVNGFLEGQISIEDAISTLLARPLKKE